MQNLLSDQNKVPIFFILLEHYAMAWTCCSFVYIRIISLTQIKNFRNLRLLIFMSIKKQKQKGTILFYFFSLISLNRTDNGVLFPSGLTVWHQWKELKFKIAKCIISIKKRCIYDVRILYNCITVLIFVWYLRWNSFTHIESSISLQLLILILITLKTNKILYSWSSLIIVYFLYLRMDD